MTLRPYVAVRLKSERVNAKQQIKNKLLRLGLALLAAIALLGSVVQAESPKTIKIGAIVSLTGPAGEQGKNWLEGAELAQDDLKAQGLNVNLVIEDDQTKTTSVATAFAKMATLDKVQAIVGGTWDFLAEAAYPLAKQYKIPFLTANNPYEILSQQAKENPFVFVSGLSLEAERAALKSFLRKEKIKSVSLLIPNIPWGTFHADMFKSLAKELNISITASYDFAYEGYPDVLKPIALKISQQPADLIFAPIDYNGIEILMREFARYKVSSMFMTTQHLDEAFTLSRDPSLYSRCFAIYPKISEKSFEISFERKYGRHAKVFASHGYDAVMFLANAINQGVNLADPNASFSYKGLTGNLKIPATNRSINAGRAVIMTTRNGVFEPWMSQYELRPPPIKM